MARRRSNLFLGCALLYGGVTGVAAPSSAFAAAPEAAEPDVSAAAPQTVPEPPSGSEAGGDASASSSPTEGSPPRGIRANGGSSRGRRDCRPPLRAIRRRSRSLPPTPPPRRLPRRLPRRPRPRTSRPSRSWTSPKRRPSIPRCSRPRSPSPSAHRRPQAPRDRIRHQRSRAGRRDGSGGVRQPLSRGRHRPAAQHRRPPDVRQHGEHRRWRRRRSHGRRRGRHRRGVEPHRRGRHARDLGRPLLPPPRTPVPK